jgi:hypothetical protein
LYFELAHFILEASIAADSIWKAGEPFLSILSASITDEVKIKAVQVFGRLLYHCYHPITEADAANTAKQLEQLQTVGDPLKNLVACLSSESIELKLGAISTLELLFIKPPSEEYYTQLETTLGGFVKLFDFTTRSEIRFNVPILQLTESFSRCSSGRDILVCHGALDVMKNLVKNAVQALNIPSPNPEETPLVLECISLLSLIIVRLVFTCDQIESLPLLEESHMIPIIDDLLIILQVLDGSNAGLVAGHESLVASVMTQVISSLGRMIERSSVVKARAKEKGLLSLLLPRLKATEPLALRVVSEKLLHICCLTQDSEARQEIIDPQILSSTEEKPSFLTLDSVLGLFTTEISTITSSPLENLSISRFVAKIVGSHENAKVLGEKPQAMEIFLTSLLQIQPTDEAEDARASQKLVGYLSKTIQAIAHISAEACDVSKTSYVSIQDRKSHIKALAMRKGRKESDQRAYWLPQVI